VSLFAAPLASPVAIGPLDGGGFAVSASMKTLPSIFALIADPRPVISVLLCSYRKRMLTFIPAIGLVGTRRRGEAAMNSFSRSILAPSLMTGAASLAFVMLGATGVRAEIVTVQGDDGMSGPDGVNPGDDGMPGVDGEPSPPPQAACSQSPRPSIEQRLPAEMAALAATATRRETAAMGGAAERQLRRRRRPLYPALREQTPLPPAATVAWAA
jgi:hypothetical protein